MGARLSRVVPAMTVAAVAAGMVAGQAAAAAPRPPRATTTGASVVTSLARTRPVPRLQPRSVAARFPGNGVNTPTLPFYSDSFSYAGKKYPYTGLGTDPRTSPATTRIPVEFIPIRIYVPGGSNWPTGAIKLTTGSALFHPSPSTNNTQYGDATLRSSYWTDVKANGGTWHVLFGKPVTKPLLAVHVPKGQGTWSLDGAGNVITLINSTWYTNELFKIANTVPPNTLAVLLTWNAVGCTNFRQMSTCGVAGIHGESSDAAGTHVFAWATWADTTLFVNGMASTSWMSNMLAATLNNPFANDTVPNWSIPSQPQVGCTNRFAVGAPLIGTFLSVGGLEYQDVADFSWFARQQPSLGFQGRYSFLGTLTKLPVAC